MHLCQTEFMVLVAIIGFAGADQAHASSQTDSEVTPETDTRETTEVPLQLQQKTWFTDVVATAVIRFPEPVEEPESLPSNDDDVSFAGLELTPSQDPTAAGSRAVIRFLPRRSGLIVFPSLEFHSETRIFRTPATQIMVSVPRTSSEMRFELRPTKTAVYVGQPLRVNVTWSSQQPTNRFRSLQCFPAVFNNEDVEIVIPRCTVPEKQQMGTPFGGRRVIARRLPPADDDTLFGTVSFSLFLRFRQPGKVEVPETRLECALLKGKGNAFAPYAAYFNNGLFEPFSSLTAYERVFAESEPFSIDVLPLPSQDRSECFSGLFAPCEIDVSISADELSVGQFLEVDLRVHSDAPHGMLDLQPLDLQRSLRGRFRVSREFGRTWYPDGTGFRARVRPLTTDISAFPSLRIPLFDPNLGTYRVLQTSSVPLKVGPHDGRDFFDVRTLVAEQTLTDQPEGIWHNTRPGTISQILNDATGLLAEHCLLWILVGATVFSLLLPWVRERRRRATDPVYRRQASAYRELLRHPEGTKQKWEAFLQFVATGFSMPSGAWTSGDAQRRLRSLDISEQDIALIVQTHAAADKFDFSSQKPSPSVPELNALARRLFTKFRNVSVMFLMVLVACPGTVMASEWREAESLFEQALNSTPGLPKTESLYVQAALKFEIAAEQNSRRGASWYNAGNAWFKAGELGRAIACYRQAQIYRPFDHEIRENLKAARALTVDVLNEPRTASVRSWPVRWICAFLVPASFLLGALLLVHIRYRTSATLAGCIASAAIVVAAGMAGLYAGSHSGSEGVIIIGEIYGRKGPAYTYNTAFHEPLHDGLEFHTKLRRSGWLQIELADGRQCWIPSDQTRLIFNRPL